MLYDKRNFTCIRNGLTIRGVEYRPEGEHLPAVIVSHGFMANHKTVLQYVRLFAEMGYAAYAFDFCGGCVIGGRSDGQTTDMSVLTEVEDLKAVIGYVSALPYIEADSLSLMGCSQGGFVSALTAAELGGSIRKLALFYPAFCIPDDARRGQMMFARFDPRNPPETFFCGPMKLGRQYVTSVSGMDPFQAIAPYTGDVLIVHGTLDNVVDMRYAQQALETYRARAAGTATLHLIDGGRHSFSKKHDVPAMAYLRDFFSPAAQGDGA